MANIVKGKTKTGFSFSFDRARMGAVYLYKMTRAMRDGVGEGEQAAAMFEALEHVLGEDQLMRLLEHVDKTPGDMTDKLLAEVGDITSADKTAKN